MASTSAASEGSFPGIDAMDGGIIRWTIDHAATKDTPVGTYVASPRFAAGSYEWAIWYYPRGSKQENNGDHISLFLKLLSDAKDVSVIFELFLLDRSGTPSATVWKRELHRFRYRNDDWGWYCFAKRSDIESSFVKDGVISLFCFVTVMRDRRDAGLRVAVPPSNLSVHLGTMLDTREGADVTFLVEGEAFSAHRALLAARSPVFRALLFGEMAESTAQRIPIDDMNAAVFKLLLRFIYTDALPDDKALTGVGSGDVKKAELSMMVQDLLAAADRYGMDRLIVLCEEKLCSTISVDTVGATLVLAEQHGCKQLKVNCLEFLGVPENFLHFIVTPGYLHLVQSCPALLTELSEKIKTPAGMKDLVEKLSHLSLPK